MAKFMLVTIFALLAVCTLALPYGGQVGHGHIQPSHGHGQLGHGGHDQFGHGGHGQIGHGGHGNLGHSGIHSGVHGPQPGFGHGAHGGHGGHGSHGGHGFGGHGHY